MNKELVVNTSCSQIRISNKLDKITRNTIDANRVITLNKLPILGTMDFEPVPLEYTTTTLELTLLSETVLDDSFVETLTKSKIYEELRNVAKTRKTQIECTDFTLAKLNELSVKYAENNFDCYELQLFNFPDLKKGVLVNPENIRTYHNKEENLFGVSIMDAAIIEYETISFVQALAEIELYSNRSRYY